MAKKQTTKANGSPLTDVIRTSANQIWLAGLGALAQAEDKGGDWFDSLTAAGEKLEKAARAQIARPMRVAEKRVTETRDSIEESWGAVLLVFERRFAKLLNSFQIPTQRDIAELTGRVEDLQAALQTLERGKTAQAASRTRAKPAKRSLRVSAGAKSKPARKKAAKTGATGRKRTGSVPARPGARSPRKAGVSRRSRAGA